MPLLEINQSTVASPINGRFHGTGSTWLPTYFETFAQGFVQGYIVLGTTRWNNFIRFKIPLATGQATINFAQIKFFGYSPAPLPGFGAGIACNILCHDNDNSPGPASHADCITQSTTQATTAVVSWEDPEMPQVEPGHGQIVLTVDFKAALEEVIARAGWASGNYVTIYFLDTTPTSGKRIRLFAKEYTDWSSESDSQYNPILLLDVTYLTGGDNNVTHDLVITDYNTGDNGMQHMSDTLDITQDLTFSRGYSPIVEDTLTFMEDILWTGSKPRTVWDDIVVDNEISHNVSYYPTVEDVIVFSEDILREGPKDFELYHEFTIEEDILAGYAHTETYFDDLVVEHTIHTPLFFVEYFDDINITTTVSIDGTVLINPHSVVDLITFTQDVSYTRDGTRDVEDVLDIGQSVLGQGMITGCNREDLIYAPVADSSIGFATKPTLTLGSILLQYPIVTPTSTITLRKPLLGNKDELQLTRIQRETRGGDLKTFIDASWPQIRVQRFKFELVTDDIRDNYFNFLMLSLGLKVKLTDHEGRVWHGYILTPDGESITINDDGCSETLEFDFVGTLTG